MPRMLDVSDDVRAEIGDEEADRLLAGDNAPGAYDCTSCRTPGNTEQERTSTVLFVGQETAVLAFAHATCVPSQVVPVSEDQLRGAVRSITGEDSSPSAAEAPHAPSMASVPSVPHASAPYDSMPHAAVSHFPGPAAPTGPAPSPVLAPSPVAPASPGVASHTSAPSGHAPAAQQAVLGVTSGVVLVGQEACPALVVEPTAPIIRPGSAGHGDEFLQLLSEQGFAPVVDLGRPPAPNPGWSVLLAMGQLHAVLMPGPGGGRPVAWWQAHSPMPLSEGWRSALGRSQRVLIYAAAAGTIGTQPREDQLRAALDRAAARGALVGASMPLAGT
ncbi:hypothetical protein GCM10009548_54180 [Streptomyces malaysiensis subsp. malaysiensis]|uniref:Uncharacterized protein n=2 Tax=Streptomyces TaxID=1883 RepID=A0ABX6W205_STRMQ|nr:MULTISPECIES: hypothetical protein [Streptomyces]QPI55497.1 hypothetical protein I1A49_11700 [Streptomyces solisilvae]UHH16947.1 hypothetical protein LUV23_11820 [Streptomyces sp. HNM0561]